MFRHAAASLLIRQVIDLMGLKAWMGHAHFQTTLDTYGHLMHDHIADAKLIAWAELSDFRHGCTCALGNGGLRPFSAMM